eukprot:jgi/Tetstr1/442232/TSEL_030373.t1
MLSRALAQLGRAASTAAGIIEMRSYQMKPEATATYLQMCAETAAVRAEVAPGFLGMFSVEAGGPLNVVRHFYRYQDMEHRHAVRAAMPKNLDWRNFLSDSKAHLQSQESWIFVPCLDVMEAGGATPISELQPTIPSGKPAGGVYELRRYQLVPGYPTVPKLRELFCEGLPEKIAADQHGKLVAFAASDVGVLNNVIELWRYDSMAASLKARQASRQATKWRECISGVAPLTQTFTTELMVPTPFSPWQ